MRVLVIGGTGFAGPHVVRRLHALGHDLTLFHRGQTRAELPAGVEEIAGDRDELPRHAERLRARRPEVVLHMLAMSGRHGRDLLAAFRGVARRVVVISSQDVYLPYGGRRRAAHRALGVLGVPTGRGLGIRVDEEKVAKYHRLYREIGQFLPYKPEMLAREER